MQLLRRRRDQPSDSPRLIPIWVAIPSVVAGGLLAAFAAAMVIWLALGRPAPAVVEWDIQAQLDTLRLALFVVGGIGGVVALVVAYRKQRINEAADAREGRKLFNDRFLSACTELGNAAGAVRLAAAYSIARLADDWSTERQACVDVLCAYLRMPYEPDPQAAGWKQGEKEVRLSIIRLISDHLTRSPADATSWRGYNFDFTGAVFDGGDWAGAEFNGGRVTFEGAIFRQGLSNFRGTTFSGAVLANFCATFTGGEVAFDGARFTAGMVNFSGWFTGAKVSFDATEFSGDAAVWFGAAFSGGSVTFHGTTFQGGEVTFAEARFTGAEVAFGECAYAGGVVDLSQARDFSSPPVFFGGEPPERPGLLMPQGD